MLDLEAVIRSECAARLELRRRILEIVCARCETGQGRVHRGALHLYVHRALGLHGSPSTPFHRLTRQVLEEAGYRASYLQGYKCYFGLAWRGELAENWSCPLAEDVPRWEGTRAKFRFEAPVGPRRRPAPAGRRGPAREQLDLLVWRPAPGQLGLFSAIPPPPRGP